MSIVGARIDNRLLHGIVATQWAPQSGATRVMVVDDIVASDPIAKESMKLGRPSGMAISIIDSQTALKNFNSGKYDNQKVFIISKTPDIFLSLLQSNNMISEIIIGGTVFPESEDDSIKVSKRAFVMKNQIETYKKIMNFGTKIEIKFVPSDKNNSLKNYL